MYLPHSPSAVGRMLSLMATSLLVALFLPSIAAATITLPIAGPPFSVSATADDQLVPGTDNQTSNLGTTLPFVDTLTATDGDASATVDVTLNQNGFDFSVALQSAGNPLGGDGSNSFGAIIRFTVDTATAYAITGSFSSSQTVGNGSASIFVLLQDSGTVFMSDQQEIVANGEGFSLAVDGSPGGDNVNSIQGAQSGTLLPGVDYFLNLSIGNSMSQTLDSGVASSGSISIAFSTVPEPTTASLFALGLVGLAALRRPPQRR